MSDPIEELRLKLLKCTSIPAVERAQDEAWAHFDYRDAVNNSLVMKMAARRKAEIRSQ